MTDSYHIIGIMSGTSLDGVDLAHCTFTIHNGSYQYAMNACETIPYSEEWRLRLAGLHCAGALQYASTHNEYGRYLGEKVKEFCHRHVMKTDFVASHGHTIFHQPFSGFTSQIGEGAALAAISGIPVICDFRSNDVALGGQGAPLVPIGDELLFGEYDYCLNLGGFANISFRKDNLRMAYDVCPVNIVLNKYAQQAGLPFDKDGLIAAAGNVDTKLLTRLNELPYYKSNPPKSLGREWLEEEFLPCLPGNMPVADLLRTLVEHIARQIGTSILGKSGKMLITGGGAHNHFLVETIKKHAGVEVYLPSFELVDYKEAIIFAFLGLLRVIEKPNCLSSVTGAGRDAISGCIYLP
jgi:anhydro-N-acetylmuramic acid kinase